MKIVILDAKTLGTTPNLADISKFGELTIYETTDKDQRIERIADAEIIITNKVMIDAYVMDHCHDLKLVCISATGMNNVDLPAADKKGIKVMNAAGYSSGSVSQHTFAMLLQLTNQINYYDKYVKSGKYAQSDIFTHYGPTIFELSGKNYGIIGMGNIGRTVAAIAGSFGANVQYYSTSGKNQGQDYPSLSLEKLLKSSDIISIHAPLNEHTRNLIGKDQLAMMQSHAILINVGRGGIVDEKALADAIDRELIGGACIDVYEQEPIDAENPLLTVKYPERLVLSPHNAWASIEARTRLVEIIMENINGFLSSET
jgi:lactate dehydrogenase-like 2-hydroxyacid dehydrogenase